MAELEAGKLTDPGIAALRLLDMIEPHLQPMRDVLDGAKIIPARDPVERPRLNS